MIADIPFELVDYIMKFAGAYNYNINKRPYIRSMYYLKNITQYGVTRALIHLKEMEVLGKAYGNFLEGWPLEFAAGSMS